MMSEADTLKLVAELYTAAAWISNHPEARADETLVAAVSKLYSVVQPRSISPPRAGVPQETASTPKTKLLENLSAASQAAEAERLAVQAKMQAQDEKLDYILEMEKQKAEEKKKEQEEQKEREKKLEKLLEERDEKLVKQLDEQKALLGEQKVLLELQAEKIQGVQPLGTSTSLHAFSYATVVAAWRDEYTFTDEHEFEWMKHLDLSGAAQVLNRADWESSWEKESCTQSAMGPILKHMHRSGQQCARIFDTHATVTLRRGLKPDFTLYRVGGVHTSASVLATIEVKVRPEPTPDGLRTKDGVLLTDSSLGQALVYCAEILADQPWRSEVYSALCNLDTAVVVQMCRDRGAGFKIFVSSPMVFLDAGGNAGLGYHAIERLVNFTEKEFGYDVPVLQPAVAGVTLAASGASGVIYMGGEQPAKKMTVYKLIQDKRSRDQELKALKQLSEVSTSDDPLCLFPRLVDLDEVPENANYVKMNYCGLPLSPMHPSYVFGDVVEALRRAHDAGLVHSDLRPANITVQSSQDESQRKVGCLIDWAFSQPAKSAQVRSMAFAPLHFMREAGEAGRAVAWGPGDDLMSLVLVYIYIKERGGMGRPRSDNLQSLLQFWKECLPCHKELYEAARRRDYGFLTQFFSCVDLR